MSLNPGDIGFVQYNADGPQNFAFVTLVDIAINEEIKFTDRGWLSDNSGFSNQVGDSTLTWTATSPVAAGTIVTISGGTASTGSLNAILFSLSTGGDQILAYQGTDAAPTFIAAINNDNLAGTFPTWDAGTISQNTSAQPEGLDNYTSVAINELDNAKYNGSTLTGDRATLLQALNNPANWIGDNTVVQSFTDSFLVTASTDNVAPTVNTLTPTDGASAVATGETLVIEFSEPIQKFTGTPTNNQIYIKKVSDNSTVDTIAVSSNQVSINGETVTIDLTSTLPPSQAYYVQIGNEVFKDLSGNAYAGISDTTTWNFTTEADTIAPSVVIQNAPATRNTSLYTVTFQFSEAVTGFVLGDISVANATASNFVAVDGNTYTADITPTGAG
ncbi:MAG: Ig-like domain-containing protein, partial [Leptolyngbyaceae bacterium]|nr:Ig-like domain-containing protein [Leptolyngbyaceae bacterium]